MDRKKISAIIIAVSFALLLAETGLFTLGSGAFTLNITTADLGLLLLIALLPFSAGLSGFKPMLKNPVLPALFASFAAVMFLSCALSSCAFISGLKYTLRYGAVTLAAFSVASAALTHRMKNFILAAVAVSGAASAVIALAESFFPGFASLMADLFRQGRSAMLEGSIRPAATLPHTNALSCFLAVSLISLFCLFSEGMVKDLLFWPAALLITAAIVATGSRNGAFAMLIPLLLLAVIGEKQQRIAAVACVALYFVIQPFFAYSSGRLTPDGMSSGFVRVELWKAAEKMFLASPMAGIGPGCYNQRLREFASEKLMSVESATILNNELNSHSWFFNILSETGIIGITVCAALLIFYLLRFASVYSLKKPGPEYALLAAVAMPFIFDAFFYSYFYIFTSLCLLLVMAYAENGAKEL